MKIAALAAGVLVFGISVAASAGVGLDLLALVHDIPGGDTLGHFLLIGVLSLVVSLAFVRRDAPRPWRAWRRVVLVLALLVTGDELLQLVLPLRSFSAGDLLANYAGILVFSLIALSARRKGPRTVDARGPVGEEGGR